MRQFDRHIAMDWSGAKGPRLPGLQVADCPTGTLAPTIIPNPKGGHWKRSDLAQWLISQMAGNKRLLLGLDCGFAYPFCDQQTYFPDHLKTPNSRGELWACIETICTTDKQFYGGSFYLRYDAPFADHLLYQTYRGKKFSINRLRITERECCASGASPTCMFKCVGSDSVGIGSVAGMRFLHYLKINFQDKIAIWPFDDISLASCVIVEVFPRLYFHLAGQNPQQWSRPNVINATLGFFGSGPLTPMMAVNTEDEADAIITSAALRSLAKKLRCWSPPKMTECARLHEGWIFGVR
ncbi:MAG: hypothetical protein ABSE08_06715 [Syntrophobacteraceae bacterium]